MTMTKPAAGSHCATWSTAVLDLEADVVERHIYGKADGMMYPSLHTGPPRALDPFAGTGAKLVGHRLFMLAEWHGLELEAPFIEEQWVEVGNATSMPFADAQFDLVVTSPTYGNRMADHHAPKEESHRNGYTYSLRRAVGTSIGDASVQLHPDNTGRHHWGPVYWKLHRAAWAETVRVLRPGGLMVLNCKDFVRTVRAKTIAPEPYVELIEATAGGNRVKARQVVRVCEWHKDVLANFGIEWLECHSVPTPGNRNGANRDARMDNELVLVGRRR